MQKYLDGICMDWILNVYWFWMWKNVFNLDGFNEWLEIMEGWYLWKLIWDYIRMLIDLYSNGFNLWWTHKIWNRTLNVSKG